ncbi:MAG: hypothetical protein P4L50_28805 [Anaerolineaceae bacterium]|nr:hypothetical protein [Anaerolineaceae bacterium]
MQGVRSQLNKTQRGILSSFERVMERPIKRDFAAKVDSLQELDPVVCQALQDQLKPGEAILTLIKVPSQVIDEIQEKDSKRFFRKLKRILTPDWVLALTGERLLLAASFEPGASPDTLSIPFENILSLQCGTILLFSWIEFRTIDEGSLRRTRIYYNTVSSRIFEALSASLRGSMHAMHGKNGLAASSTQDNQQILDPLSYKFKNLIGLYLLLPDEGIRSLIFRPAMWNRTMGFFQRQTAANLAVVSSQSYFMLAEENLDQAKVNYGMIYSYFPMRFVKSVSVGVEEGRLQLVVCVQNQQVGQELRIDFPAEREKELRAFAGQFDQQQAGLSG